MECDRCLEMRRVGPLECGSCGIRNRGCIVLKRGLLGEMARVCCRCWVNVPPVNWRELKEQRMCACTGRPEMWDGRTCVECATRDVGRARGARR